MMAYKVFCEVGDELHSLTKYKNHWGISYQRDVVNVPTLENSLLFVFETRQQAEYFARTESPFMPPLVVWSVLVESILPCGTVSLIATTDKIERFWEGSVGAGWYSAFTYLTAPNGTHCASSVELLEHISSWSYGEKVNNGENRNG